MRDEWLEPETRKRIANHDYEAVFAHGGCFHFALRLHERFKYKIRGVRKGYDEKNLSHVWCQKTGTSEGVDIRGVYHEDILVLLANGGRQAAACDVSIDEMREMIRAKEYPAELETEICQLADWIVDNHERFEAVKPLDGKWYAQFAKDMESKCDGGSIV